MTRSPLAAAILVALAGAASACGDDGRSGAPTDASVTEFCEVNRFEALSSLTNRDATTGAQDALRDWGDELAGVGTPEDIPDDARTGFELVVERTRGDRADGSAGETDVDAFYAYVAETCGGTDDLGLPEVPALPSE